MTQEPQIHTVFEPVTATWQYIVADPTSKNAVIIDPVLDYDKSSGEISTKSADNLLKMVAANKYTVSRILETHAHADHLSASRYLQNMLAKRQPADSRPQVCIGARIQEVQKILGPSYNIPPSEMAKAFDYTFHDDEVFKIGNLDARVIHLPGHTPDHIGYVIGSNVFTGDSIFNPDVGSARCDFPGGSAVDLFGSTQKLLSLPGEFKLYTGHDYPPETRESGEAVPFTTVETQRKSNKHVREGVDMNEFVAWRSERDSGLSEPKLLRQAMQVNLRGGRLPATSTEALKFADVPPGVEQVLNASL